MAAIATRAPGFAAMSWDSTGQLVITTTPDADPSAVVSAIGDPEIAGRFRGVYDALVGNRFAMVRDATFDFRMLMSLRDSLRPALEDSLVLSISIDEVRNALRIGTTSAANEERIREAATELAIPAGALLLVRDSASTKQTSLRDYFDPIPGGVQAYGRTGPSSGKQCTIGANVSTQYGTGFVTVSHCTRTPWHLDDSYVNFYQPSFHQDYLVGYEYADPTPSELLRMCEPYDNCRLSDAAFILYDDSLFAELGYVARTEELGSTTIDSWNPRFEITDEGGWLLVGADVNMMGRSSGWTAGEVTETCVDRPGWFGSGTNLECQTEADYDSQDGDSGGPVFGWDYSGDEITIEGIHVGRNGTGPSSRAYFSPWTSIAFELGAVLGAFTAVP